MFKEDRVNLGDCYDYAKFTLVTGSTNYDVKANQSKLFLYVPFACKFIIDSNQNLTMRFNRTAYEGIDLNIGDCPSEYIDKLNISNLFLSNSSGSTATIRIWLMP